MNIFKVATFLDSNLTPEYREFLSREFHIGIIGIVNNNKLHGVDPLFYDWNCNMIGSSTFNFTQGNNSIKLLSSALPYSITNTNLIGGRTYDFPYPNNISEFISDCQRCGVNLHWSDYAIKQNNIRHMISPLEYQDYIANLLDRVGKE